MISGLLARLRSLWRGLRHRPEFESEMSEEFRLHVQMRAADLERNGLSPAAALRRARLGFGSAERFKEESRASRGLVIFDRLWFSWLDVKIGLRMLRKNPGLTVVSVFALAVAIPVGLTPLHLANALSAPLPVEDGHRIHLLRLWNRATSSSEPTKFNDFLDWRAEVEHFQALGAFRTATYNLDFGDGRAAGAEVTASVFEVLRVAPRLGRAFAASDEVIGAPDVVIVGHALWQSHFRGDPHVIGQTLRIGLVPHTVVGVMPEGFLFPVRQAFWLPLRDARTDDPSAGPPITIFGRLAEGSSLAEAQAELTVLSDRLATRFPAPRSDLLIQAVQFRQLIFSFAATSNSLILTPEFILTQFAALLLLLVACANVGLLIFARTDSRAAEFALRTALGAGRARIVSQVFAETLVLAVLGTGIGLLVIDAVTIPALSLLGIGSGASLPYWVDLGLTPDTVLFALALAVLTACLAGVVPL